MTFKEFLVRFLLQGGRSCAPQSINGSQAVVFLYDMKQSVQADIFSVHVVGLCVGVDHESNQPASGDLHNPQAVLRSGLLLARDTQLQARSAASLHSLSPCQSGCNLSNPQSPHCRRLGHRCSKAYACRARCLPRWVRSASALQTVVDGTGTGAVAQRSCLSQTPRRSWRQTMRLLLLFGQCTRWQTAGRQGWCTNTGHRDKSFGLAEISSTSAPTACWRSVLPVRLQLVGDRPVGLIDPCFR